ncbi:MAG TPA: RtcB family protein [Planctomycetaceae bacterium]|nr:RtcB family protein [Planctomycetaceae bacterium]
MRSESECVRTLDVDPSSRPVTLVGNDEIIAGLDDACIQQAINARLAPGVTNVVVNPDAHVGYGAPVGCVMTSPTHIYPGPVGVDIKCSMSLLQTNIPASEIDDRKIRKQLIKAICARIPTGTGRGQRSAPKARRIDTRLGFAAATRGASKQVLKKLGIPKAWAERCEDAAHTAADGSFETLEARLDAMLENRKLERFAMQASQLGSLGGGNHFGECETVKLSPNAELRQTAQSFGLRDGCVAFLSHCGSRGFGHTLATRQFSTLKSHFRKSGLAFPAGDQDLVYAPLGSDAADCYLSDMAMGANFATVNHLLINQLVLEAFQQVIPGTQGQLVYFISHNIARREMIEGRAEWVHRKGATRAFPAGHPELTKTPFADTGHPILLPGNPRDGSSVMVALPGAARSAFSVNHGAGRQMSRRKAKLQLDQDFIDAEFAAADILSNCARYPKDEAPAAYKDFSQVLASVQGAGLAVEVARLNARFVIKDGAEPDD